jgi:hypothetical protein
MRLIVSRKAGAAAPRAPVTTRPFAVWTALDFVPRKFFLFVVGRYSASFAPARRASRFAVDD